LIALYQRLQEAGLNLIMPASCWLASGFEISLGLLDIILNAIVVAAAAHDEIATSLTPYYYAFLGLGCAAWIVALAAQLQLISCKRTQRQLAIASPSKAAKRSEGGCLEEVCCEIKEVTSALLLAVCQARCHTLCCVLC
jgi:hypothetical protein